MDEHSGHGLGVSKARLEFLVDGIFAIAMTVLVLELKIPEVEHHRSVRELGSSLLHHAGTFGSYLLSFMVLGVLWYWHNRRYHYYRRITKSILVAELLQLSMAAFFPFCAALLGQYLFNPLARSLYVACVAVYRVAGHAEWVGARRAGVMIPELSDEEYEMHRKRGVRACILLTALVAINIFNCVANVMG